ncbi:hypothetical protein D8B26_005855 [Coccidioides posadasii str. Silveira]|uniref:uncharacterized protein n=1 Tax=Coccidioides posadasii (strain RMSCC 757 / Silveira) TaxID=443226 RepID=UPI001BEEEDAA|nr:hypothetical protein D8B26_005855 [Coccidioides posadasii str. Silveira]
MTDASRDSIVIEEQALFSAFEVFVTERLRQSREEVYLLPDLSSLTLQASNALLSPLSSHLRKVSETVK